MIEGRKRGVIFDVGHGGGSFLYRVAVPLIKQGFLPDSISTDLHIGSMNAGMKDQLNVMSKFLAMGVPLDSVFAMSTWNPAKEIKQDAIIGHLSPGADADIAVFRLEKGKFGFTDMYGARMDGESAADVRTDDPQRAHRLRPERHLASGMDVAAEGLHAAGQFAVGRAQSGPAQQNQGSGTGTARHLGGSSNGKVES